MQFAFGALTQASAVCLPAVAHPSVRSLHESFVSGMLCARKPHAEHGLAQAAQHHYILGIPHDLNMKLHERKSNSINFK